MWLTTSNVGYDTSSTSTRSTTSKTQTEIRQKQKSRRYSLRRSQTYPTSLAESNLLYSGSTTSSLSGSTDYLMSSTLSTSSLRIKSRKHRYQYKRPQSHRIVISRKKQKEIEDEEERTIRTLLYDESPKWLQRNQEQITILSSLQKKLKNMKTQYRQDMKSCKRYLLELSMIINQRREGRLFKKK